MAGFDAPPGGRFSAPLNTNGNTTSYAFDSLNRTLTDQNELSESRSYEYDSAGNVVLVTDRDGRVTAFDYDNLNRKTAERWLDGSGNTIHTIAYTYDASGSLLTAADPDSSTTIAYDGQHRVQSITTVYAAQPTQQQVFSYGYDADGRVTEVTGTVGGTTLVHLTKGYDDDGRLTHLTDPVGGRRVDFTYNSLGQCQTLTRYSDTAGINKVATTTYGYDDANRLSSLVHALGQDGLTALSYGFIMDAADQITALTTPDGESTIGYDDDGQVTSASLTDEDYAYDAGGNRTSDGSMAGGDNRLSEDDTYSYAYDGEGNLITRVRKDGTETVTYTWDHRNRLTGVTVQDGDSQPVLTASYVYDAFDRRIARTVSGSETVDEQYVYEGVSNAQATLVLDGDGEAVTRILYGTDENQVLAEENLADSGTKWALSDHENSVRDVVDNTGTVLDDIVYDSFGNVVSQSSPSNAMRSGYTGAPTDAETGFTYLHRRYFDPQAGRFVSQDPAGFTAGDTNLYRYVGNSPLDGVDPSGMCAKGTSLDANDPHIKELLKVIGDPYYTSDVRVKCLEMLQDEMRKAGMSEDSIQDDLRLTIRTLSAQFNVQNAAVHQNNPAYDGWQTLEGSANIVLNKLTFGGSDYIDLTHTSELRGNAFVASRAFGDADAFVLTLLPGAGVAEAGSVTEMLINASRVGQAGMGGYNIGTGLNQIGQGNYGQGALRIAEGGMQAFGAFGGMDTPASGGRLGSLSTRAQVADVATELESRGWTVTGGGGKFPEEYLPGLGGGRKGANYVDITGVKNSHVVRINTIDTLADDITPTAREAAAAAAIRAKTGGNLLLIPKRP